MFILVLGVVGLFGMFCAKNSKKIGEVVELVKDVIKFEQAKNNLRSKPIASGFLMAKESINIMEELNEIRH